MNKYLTTRQAMKILGITRLATLYSYIHSGALKAHRIGNQHSTRTHWRIAEADLTKFIQGR